MLTRKKLYKTHEYWLDNIQNEIYRELNAYMVENNLNQTKLANKLGFTKGYISQILNGNFNFSLSKLIELALKINKAPLINFIGIEDILAAREKEENPFRLTFSIDNPTGFDTYQLDATENNNDSKVA